MIDKKKFIALYMDSDSAPDKGRESTAADIVNLESSNNGSTGSLSPVNASSEFSDIPLPEVLGHVEFNTNVYFLTRDDPTILGHGNYIRLNKLDLLTGTVTDITPAGMVIEYASGAIVDMIAVKETEDILKVYWCGGGEQLCSINVLADNSAGVYDPRAVKPQRSYIPTVESTLSGGSLKAGTIQYAYSQVQLHGSETLTSPLSLPSSISLNGVGGNSGEIMNISKVIKIPLSDVDVFPYIRVFSIHYQELNQLPQITLIYEGTATVDGSNIFTLIDDGNLYIAEYSVDDFLFIGGKLLYPNTLAQKNNRLFIGNYDDSFFDVPFKNSVPPLDNTDCRMFAFNSSGVARITSSTGSDIIDLTTPNSSVAETHDCVNPDRTVYNYLPGGVTTPGAQGPNFKMTFVSGGTFTTHKSLKEREVYRLGFILFDKFMRPSSVKWSIDFLVPTRAAHLSKVQGIKIEFTGELDDWKALGIEAFQPVIVQRLPKDMTVTSPGILVPGAEYNWFNTGQPAFDSIVPYYTIKRIMSPTTSGFWGGDIAENYQVNFDYGVTNIGGNNSAIPTRHDEICFFYSSDTVFGVLKNEVFNKVDILYYSYATFSTKGQTKVTSWTNGGVVGQSIFGLNLFYLGLGPANFPTCILSQAVINNSANVYNFETVNYYKGTLTRVSSPSTVSLSTPTLYLSKNSSDLIGTTRVASFIDIFGLIAKGDTYSASYAAQMADSIVIKFDTSNWNSNGGWPWDKFINALTMTTYHTAVPVVELSRTLTNQYGGNTYEAKSRNIYLPLGRIQDIDASYTEHYIGDVTYGTARINTSDGMANRQPNYWNIYEYFSLDNCENNVDVHSRADLMQDWDAGLAADVNSSYRIDDNHKLLGAYNQVSNLKVYTGKPPLFSTVYNYPVNILASKVKYSNEVVDSWMSFLPNETLSLQGTYGSLIKLYNFNNEIYSFQEKAVAQLLIQPKVQIQANVESGVELGTGQVLYNYTYINTLSGTRSPLSIVTDGNILLYYDWITNTINSLNGEEISKTKLIQNILNQYIPTSNAGITKMTAVYANGKNEFYFMLNNTILVYNTVLQQFQRRDTADTDTYLFGGLGRLYSVKTDGYVNIRYVAGTKKPAAITYFFSPYPDQDKVFHNIEYRSRGDIRVTNVSVITAGDLTGILPLPSGEVRVKTFEKFRIKRIHLPRITGSRDRLRDTNISVTLTLVDGTTLYADKSYLDDLVLMYSIKG